MKGHMSIVGLLVAHPNIDVNLQNQVWSFLSYIQTYSCFSLMFHIIIQNYNVKSGNTALINASRFGFTDVVKQLLAHPNVDVNIKDQVLYYCLGISQYAYFYSILLNYVVT